MYTITLADEKKITNLEKNGDNFISKQKIDEVIFKHNLSVLKILDGETETVLKNAELIQQVQYADGWYLAFRELSEHELLQAELEKQKNLLYEMTQAILSSEEGEA